MTSIADHPSAIDFFKILQTSISPVVLISGIGLLVLSMTNRLGRAIDRVRSIAAQMREGNSTHRPRLARQLRVLFQRAMVLRAAISLSVLAIFGVSILIFALFAMAVFNLPLVSLAMVIFVVSLLALIASMACLIYDLRLSLAALSDEIADVRDW